MLSNLWAPAALIIGSITHALARECGDAYGLPFHTDGIHITSDNGTRVQLFGANWPGHQESMIPEGLQYNSMRNIASGIKSLGFNIVRVTFATEMIDDLYDNGMKDTTLADSLVKALGETNGTRILKQILQNNPQFTAQTTRLEVFDALSLELARQGIVYYLDNHVSKAKWCCNSGDGNAWFGDTYFDPVKWKRGLVYMARRARRYPSMGIIGMRNEFRRPSPTTRGLPWNWFVWYQYMTDAANEIHAVNPDILMSMMGMPWLDQVVEGRPLSGPNITDGVSYTAYFRPEEFSWSKKVILENHRYDVNPTDNPNCTRFLPEYLTRGFNALDLNNASVALRIPVILGEWGYPQDGSYYHKEYPQCLLQLFEQFKPNWMYWTLAGSYYSFTRYGEPTIQDFDDGYGLFNHDWSGWRSPETIENYFKEAVMVSTP